MGVVYYANYYIWMEVGRTAFCYERGFSYRDLELNHGGYLVVAESSCRYKAPARYDDEVIVRTSLQSVQRRTARFGYQIYRVDGLLLAEGETFHVLVDRAGRPTTFPVEHLEVLKGSVSA